ncbi:hypothetical protein MUP77_08730 [Candidatus Bathyarchaeota archaeon]|nr:hypothetical protein [Candidatus Bathyarchaeota archaeon]
MSKTGTPSRLPPRTPTTPSSEASSEPLQRQNIGINAPQVAATATLQRRNCEVTKVVSLEPSVKPEGTTEKDSEEG